MNTLKLELTQKLQITQQLVQAITILAMSGQELNKTIEKELLENPVLELAENVAHLDAKWTQYNKGQKSVHDVISETTVQTTNLQDYLMTQVRLNIKENKNREIAEFIVGSLNDNGYLEYPIAKIAKKFSVSEKKVNEIRRIILDFDPIGFASLNMTEFLLFQLEKKESNKINQLATLIIKEHLNSLALGDIENIVMGTTSTAVDVEKAITVIKNLVPRPVNALKNDISVQYITPDIMIEKIKDKYIVTLNPMYTRQLKIQDDYRVLRKTVDKETRDYLNKNIQSASWIIQCLKQREETIRKISEILVLKQKDFLDNGLIYMKPLTLKDVAITADVHESTVSRTVNAKYALTPHGTIPLKAFFPSGLKSIDGSKISTAKIKEKIVKIIKEAPKISDQKISNELQKKGIKIARRTVTKYRRELGLQSSFNRKKKTFS